MIKIKAMTADSPRLRGWLWGLLLVIATFVAYQAAWNGKPIWDDAAHLTYPELRSWSGLVRIWTVPGTTQQYYPLTSTVFWVEAKFWGDSTLGYHLVNILLHATAALLLLTILRTLQVPGAGLAAAIFALHPVQVESVAWISELKNTFSGVFFFGSALAYLRFDRTRNKAVYVGALVLFVLGLLAKTVIATLPAALLVVFWWQRGKLSWKQDVLALIPFFAAGITAGLFTSWMERQVIGAQGSGFNFSLVERCLIAGRAIWFYLAGGFDFFLPSLEDQPGHGVAILFSGGGGAAVGCAVGSEALGARACGGAAFLYRNALPGVGLFECVSIHLFIRGGSFSVSCLLRPHRGGQRWNPCGLPGFQRAEAGVGEGVLRDVAGGSRLLDLAAMPDVRRH
jgi:hypothetical protein